jgi:hypothetical protein
VRLQLICRGDFLDVDEISCRCYIPVTQFMVETDNYLIRETKPIQVSIDQASAVQTDGEKYFADH